MEEKMKQYIRDNQLIETGDRIVIGVSGGADSICLLELLNEVKEEYQLELHVVHVNHGLRGQAAKEDEVYVQKVCNELGLPFHVYCYDVAGMAKERGLSTEEAGRLVRYEAFQEECHKSGCTKIAIAHNENDNAETVLFHLIRGSGLKGLTGIAPARRLEGGVTIIRPLLGTSREEIEEILKERGRAYQTDATNLSDEYSRNKVRNQVLRYMKEEINEKAVEHISNTANHLKEIDNFIKDCVNQAYDVYVRKEIDGSFFVKQSLKTENIVIQKELLRRVLEEMRKEGLKDVDAQHVEMILQLFQRQVGKSICLPGGRIVKKEYDGICFQIKPSCMEPDQNKPIERQIDIQEPGEYYLEKIGKTLQIGLMDYVKCMRIPKNIYTKWFDYDKINHTVVIRKRAAGDFIQVHAAGGRKKLKDYFIDSKIPRQERDSYLMLADGQHIMWIIGDRISERYKVNEDTKKILVISLIGGKL